MTPYVVYDKDGKILKNGHCKASDLQLQGEFVLDVIANSRAHYILDGDVTPRPENPARISGTTLTHLPNPSEVRIEDATVTVTDGLLELSFEFPGVYRVKVSSFPFLDREFDIEIPS